MQDRTTAGRAPVTPGSPPERRMLSSSLTWVYKYVLPATWIPAMGLAAYALSGAGQLTVNDVPVDAPAWLGLVLAGFWILGSALILGFATPLKRVLLDGDALVISNGFREARVPLALVTDVRQNRWVNVRPITVQLRVDLPGVGRRFTFAPPWRLRFRAWREDPEAAELRRLSGLALTRPAGDRPRPGTP